MKEINLNIPHGKTTALVGPSGSGKSSILNLIPRFYDPDTGNVKIDNQDIKELSIASVRSSIALVSQEPILFDMSIQIIFYMANLTLLMMKSLKLQKQLRHMILLMSFQINIKL